MLHESGLDPNRFLDELTPEEIHALCAWQAERWGGPGRHMCDELNSYEVDTVEACVEKSRSRPRPHCRAGLFFDCMSALGNNYCRLYVEEGCKPYFSCGSG